VAEGQRVFHVKIQGETVLRDFDVNKEAKVLGETVIKELSGIEVAENLIVELVPKSPKPSRQQAPILQAVDIEREEVIGLGMTPPSFFLNNDALKQKGEVVIVNLKGEDFRGILKTKAQKGFSVRPRELQIQLRAGEKESFPVEVGVEQGTARGTYPLEMELLREDKSRECLRSAEVEHLAERGRSIVKAVEDVFVGQSFSGTARPDTKTILVDGGDQKMGDHSHHLAFLKVRLDLPGKPMAVSLRLYNSGNPTGDSGRVCLVSEPWDEEGLHYDNRPKPGKELARLGPVMERQVVEVPLEGLSLDGLDEVSLMIDPTSCDGTDYYAREGGTPAELVIEYELASPH